MAIYQSKALFLSVGFFIKKLLLVLLEVPWDDFYFFRKIRGDIRHKVCSVVYDKLRNGDSAVYDTLWNGDSAVYLKPRR